MTVCSANRGLQCETQSPLSKNQTRGPRLQCQLWGGGDRQIPGADRIVSLDLGMSPRPMKDSNPNNTAQRRLSG